jgi:hypothetical protein
MQRDMTENDVGPFPMAPVMFGEQSGIGLHVVVKEKEQFSAGHRGASIARRSGSPVRLLQNSKGKRCIKSAESVGRTVIGSVHHHDNFVAAVKLLTSQRPDEGQHQLSTLVSRHDYTEAVRGGHAAICLLHLNVTVWSQDLDDPLRMIEPLLQNAFDRQPTPVFVANRLQHFPIQTLPFVARTVISIW